MLCTINSNDTIINYLTIFLKIIDVENSYWFLSGPTTNITFLIINNHSLHQQFVKKKFIKYNMTLAQ